MHAFVSEIRSNLLTVRLHKKLMKVLFYNMAIDHATDNLPRHFTYGAYQLYDYKRRARKYTEKKFKLYGHRNPNVLTGELKLIILASARANITSTSGGFRMLPRGTAQHRMWPQQKYELEQINEKELADFATNLANRYTRMAGTGEYTLRQRQRVKG